MANKMLIDATHPEETRVVVLRGNRVEEFDFESASRRQLRGNIYLAKVTRVEPSLQAAFVDYGGNRHGFLAFSEIHPDYYQIPVADRLALIEEEERAHLAAEAEADRRAAARSASRSAAANQSQQRGQRVVSQRVTETGDEPAQTPASQPSAGASAADAPTETDEGVAPFAGGQTRDALEGERFEAVARAPEGSESSPPAATADNSAEPLPVASLLTFGQATAEQQEASDLAGTAPASEAADPQPVAGNLPEVAAAADDRSSAVGEDDEGDGSGTERELNETVATSDDGNDDEEDEDEDDDEGDEDDDEEDEDDEEGESSEREETVESVGGADALEEAQERAPRVRRQYKIQEVIKRRQIMLVQVVKEERGTKGAALTTYLSLAGRYSVLMPNTARGGGISRKITSPQDRNRLKEIATDLEVPEGMGVILRTAGATRTKTEIKRDFEYLLRMWEQVRDLTLKSTAPTLVYEEGSVIKRAIRDLYNKEIDEVIVAGEEAHREAKDFMRMLMPSHAKNVKPYVESQPLLSRFGVESQLEAMFSPVVQLRSGGYIVLNQAEALVAIDVNSGRATREHHIEDTALKTNLEAAEEIARQLRLRDLAGLIVIDFIDMDEKRNNRAVERRLKECLKNDRARIQVGRISHFGLLEMSRQRIRTSVFESSTEKCPHCGGTGHVRSVASVALQCLRMLEETLLRGATHNIIVRTAADVSLYVLNQKRAHLRELEQRFRISVTIKPDGAPGGQHAFAIEKGEQVHSLEQARALAAQPVILLPTPVAEEDELEDEGEYAGEDVPAEQEEDGEEAERADGGDNGSRRRRRRRRRGRRDERGEAGAALRETAVEHGVAQDDHDGGEGEDDDAGALAAGARHASGEDGGSESDAAAETRRRRRRGRRGGRRNRRSEGEARIPNDAADETAEHAHGEDVEAIGGVGEPLSNVEQAGDEREGAPAQAASTADAHSYEGDAPDYLGDMSPAPLADERVDATEAPLSREQVDDLPPFLAAPVETASPSGAAGPVAPAEAEEPEAARARTAESAGIADEAEPTGSSEAPRRRSTVRERVAFPPEGAQLGEAASVESAESAEAAVQTEDRAAADPPARSESSGSRRTGWWSRRLMGGNKG
jgi:ribonuclease E